MVAADQSPVRTRYVLLTQCLQNDFFLNRECRLFLPDSAVRTMLLGKKNFDKELGTASRRPVDPDELASGPLGLLLNATIGRRMRNEDGADVLDVINIRDWHESDDNYDVERRLYGSHCEQGTWGAQYIEGLERYLDPGGAPPTKRAEFFEQGRVRIHQVHADSLFDFRPRSEQIGAGERKFQKSALEVILDVILQGSEDDLRKMRQVVDVNGKPVALWEVAKEDEVSIALGELTKKSAEATAPDTRVPHEEHDSARVYVAVLGVYTDLKIKTLLTGL